MVDDGTAILNPSVRMRHDEMIGHALEMGFGDAHFAIARATRPMSEKGIDGAISGDDAEVRAGGPGGQLPGKRLRLGAEFLTVYARHEFKRFPITDAVDQSRALVGWGDHHDTVEVGRETGVFQITTKDDSAHRVRDDHERRCIGVKFDAMGLELSGQPVVAEFFEGDTERVVVEICDPIALARKSGFDPFHRPTTEAEAVNEHGFGWRGARTRFCHRRRDQKKETEDAKVQPGKHVG